MSRNEARRRERRLGFVLQPASANTAASSYPLDQRAHPPRRRFASAGKGEKRKAKPRRDIARLGRRALRSQRIVARKIHRKRAIA